MKVFISWSGERSQIVADALRKWLPYVLPFAEPWLSAADIPKGARWGSTIAAELEETQTGIICVTPENVQSPWMLFEAGALSKLSEVSYVCTYLLDMSADELKGPLSQFQSTLCTESDTLRLVEDLNRKATKPLASEYVRDQFATWWVHLKSGIDRATEMNRESVPQSEQDTLNELLRLLHSSINEERISSAVQEAVQNVLKSPEFLTGLRDTLSVDTERDEDTVRQLLRNALSDARWNWRTPSVIAKQSGIGETEALRILRKMAVEGEIRFSPSEPFGIVVGLTDRT